MADNCYAMVRGSSLRVTGLLPCGTVPSPVPFGVSKSVARVRINEVSESGSNELLRNEEDQPRVHLVKSAETIRFTADVEFLRVDPAVFSLITGVPVVYGPGGSVGFGESEFGIDPFGDGVGSGSAVGFDATTRRRPKAFALEVWSRLAQRSCDGDRQWGYTLFPYLKGGRLSGFQFSGGLVSFNLIGAQTRKGSKWGYGPYDLEGEWMRLDESVSGNLHWRTFITTAVPPTEQDGVSDTEDVLDNGFADSVYADNIDGGSASINPEPPVLIEGGNAA